MQKRCKLIIFYFEDDYDEPSDIYINVRVCVCVWGGGGR